MVVERAATPTARLPNVRPDLCRESFRCVLSLATLMQHSLHRIGGLRCPGGSQLLRCLVRLCGRVKTNYPPDIATDVSLPSQQYLC